MFVNWLFFFFLKPHIEDTCLYYLQLTAFLVPAYLFRSLRRWIKLRQIKFGERKREEESASLVLGPSNLRSWTLQGSLSGREQSRAEQTPRSDGGGKEWTSCLPSWCCFLLNVTCGWAFFSQGSQGDLSPNAWRHPLYIINLKWSLLRTISGRMEKLATEIIFWALVQMRSFFSF